LPGIPDFPLNSGWKPLWYCNYYILHACKTSIKWMMPRSASSSNSSWASLDHSCSGLWVSGWLNVGKHLLAWSRALFSKQSSSNELKPLHPWACYGWDLASS
jgi:hypothetical protein